MFQMMSPLLANETGTLQSSDTLLVIKAFICTRILNALASVFPECSAVRWIPGCTADAHYSSGFRGNTQPLGALLQHADGLQHW